jgi:prophage tail gpP-like protein
VPKPEETCVIIVNGRRFRDWKTVLVHAEMNVSHWYYKFSTTEGRPLAKDWAEIRIVPGDHASVILAGHLALSSMVTDRQVAYTATQHGIEIIGKTAHYGATVAGASGGQGGEFLKKTMLPIVNDVLGKAGLSGTGGGGEPFNRMHISPGQSIWDFVEGVARQRGMHILPDNNKNYHFFKGKSIGVSGDSLVEGVNILEARELISVAPGDGPYIALGMNVPLDDQPGWSAALRSMAQVKGQVLAALGSKGQYSPSINRMEHAGTSGAAADRSGHEQTMSQGAEINVQIVVYGWLKPTGGLWLEILGKEVHVKSPMLVLDRPLTLRAVTHTQDDKTGTRTTLDLVDYGKLGGPDVRAGGQ